MESLKLHNTFKNKSARFPKPLWVVLAVTWTQISQGRLQVLLDGNPC